MSGNIEADPEKVAELTRYLLEQLDEYLQNHNIPATDTFMAVHNLHVMIVTHIAKRWESIVPEVQTYRMADMTFRKAIRELRLPSKSTS